VRSDVHLLFTKGAFSPSALVLFRFTSRFTCILDFIHLATLEAFFVGETDGRNIFSATMKMVRVTVLTNKGSMTQTIKRRG